MYFLKPFINCDDKKVEQASTSHVKKVDASVVDLNRHNLNVNKEIQKKKLCINYASFFKKYILKHQSLDIQHECFKIILQTIEKYKQ